MSAPEPVWNCSFCGVQGRGTQGVVAGARVFICRACIAEGREQLTAGAAVRVHEHPWAIEVAGTRCSFCSRSAEQQRLVLTRREAKVCVECVEVCEEIFAEQAR